MWDEVIDKDYKVAFSISELTICFPHQFSLNNHFGRNKYDSVIIFIMTINHMRALYFDYI